MKVNVKWTGDGAAFDGETESGHTVRMDSSPAFGGKDSGARPMEMVLLGMGGCSSIDVVSILKKSRQAISDCVVEISAERVETTPKVFSHIHMHFKVTGQSIEPSRVERAIQLSVEKYCSAVAMLAKTAEITHDYEIIDAG